MNFTENEMEIMILLGDYRNYNDLETELSDNAVGVYMEDVTTYTTLKDPRIIRGVLSSLIQKDMLYTDRVNGEMFFRATDECLEYCYNVLDKENEI